MRQRLIGWIILCGLLVLSVGNLAAQFGVRIVVVNEFANIRTIPAIGAPVIDSVPAGTDFTAITGRSGDNQWVRLHYAGTEGWINLVPVVILEGSIANLPVADPRTIPFGGFEAPRSGRTEFVGSVDAAATDGLRVRAGPSTAYPTLANINFNQAFTITGRNYANTWYQVNFENTLGWVSANFVRIISGDVGAVPLNGIIADEPPRSTESLDDYLATLRFMRDRVNIAQQSLDRIRASWTDSAITGRASCQPYPPRPTDFNIAVPLLAANFNTLNPLVEDFNDAMFNIRKAIDLFIEVCNQPGTGNPVGQATVQGALGVVNLADQQLGSLRQRLNDLIPDLTIGENECLLAYNLQAEVLPFIQYNTVYLDGFTRRVNARGYCINGLENQILNIQGISVPPAELELFIAFSPLDDPTNFLTVNRSFPGQKLEIGPIVLDRTTTYLLIIADLGGTNPDGTARSAIGDFAFAVFDRTFGGTEQLEYDEETNSVVLITPETPTDNTDTVGGVGGNTGGTTAPVACPGLDFNCFQLFSCDEARACYEAGNLSLDSDGNNIPCDEPQYAGLDVSCAGQ